MILDNHGTKWVKHRIAKVVPPRETLQVLEEE